MHTNSDTQHANTSTAASTLSATVPRRSDFIAEINSYMQPVHAYRYSPYADPSCRRKRCEYVKQTRAATPRGLTFDRCVPEIWSHNSTTRTTASIFGVRCAYRDLML